MEFKYVVVVSVWGMAHQVGKVFDTEELAQEHIDNSPTKHQEIMTLTADEIKWYVEKNGGYIE